MVWTNLFVGQEQRHRCGDGTRREEHSGGWGGWDGLGDEDRHTHRTMQKTESQGEPAVYHRELSQMLCDNLEAISPRGGGRSKSRGIYVYMWLIHFFVQQKLTQHCQTTILQLKKKKIICAQTYHTASEPRAFTFAVSLSLIYLFIYLFIYLIN